MPKASADAAPVTPAEEASPPAEPKVWKLAANFGLIHSRRHRFWEAGTEVSDPETLQLLFANGASLIPA